MSWKIFVQDLPRKIKSVSEIDENFKPKNIGTRKDIIESIKTINDKVDCSDITCEEIEFDKTYIDIFIGDAEEVTSFT